MGLLEVASILAWLVVATIAVPRCEIPTPTGATACTTTDHWRDDVLCRLFGSTVTQTTGGGAGGGPAVTTTFQAYDGLLMNAYQRVTDSNKYRRKSGNKAVVSRSLVLDALLTTAALAVKHLLDPRESAECALQQLQRKRQNEHPD